MVSLSYKLYRSGSMIDRSVEFVKKMDKLVAILFIIAHLVTSHSVFANRRPIRSVLAPAGK